MGATLRDNLIPIEQIPLGHAEVANWAAIFFLSKNRKYESILLQKNWTMYLFRNMMLTL